jgi:hypothetical protein
LVEASLPPLLSVLDDFLLLSNQTLDVSLVSAAAVVEVGLLWVKA